MVNYTYIIFGVIKLDLSALKASKTFNTGYLFCGIMLSVFPLLVFNYSNTTAWKNYSFILIIILALIGCALNPQYFNKNTVKATFSSPTMLCLLLYICTAIASIIASPYRSIENSDGSSAVFIGSGRSDGLMYLLLFSIAMIIPAVACGARYIYAYLLSVTVVINTAICIPQLAGYNPLGLIPNGAYTGQFISFAGTFGNIDFLSAFLCVAACYIGAYYIVCKDGKERFALPFCFGAAVFTELSINVSSGFVALVVTLLIAVPIFASERKHLPRLLDILTAGAAAAALASVIKYNYPSGENYTEVTFKFGTAFFIGILLAAAFLLCRLFIDKIPDLPQKNILIVLFSAEGAILVIGAIIIKFFFMNSSGLIGEISALLNGTLDDMAGSHRVAIWRYSLKLFGDYPLLGSGLGTFKLAFNDTYAAQYHEAIGKVTTLDSAHNEYLHTLVTTGILGFAAYMGMLITQLVRAVKYMFKNPNIMICFFAAFAFAVQMFFNVSIVHITPYFFLMLGMTEYEIRKAKKSAEPITDDEERNN